MRFAINAPFIAAKANIACDVKARSAGRSHNEWGFSNRIAAR
jgi:hypothetical protein